MCYNTRITNQCRKKWPPTPDWCALNIPQLVFLAFAPQPSQVNCAVFDGGLTEEELYVEAGLVTVALLSWCQHAVTVQDGPGGNAASASQQTTAF